MPWSSYGHEVKYISLYCHLVVHVWQLKSRNLSVKRRAKYLRAGPGALGYELSKT